MILKQKFMFNFLGKFNKNKEEPKGFKAAAHTEESLEELKRVNKKDPLRNYVPIDEVSLGNDWESYGEGGDNLEEEKRKQEEEAEYSDVLTSDSSDEDKLDAAKHFLNQNGEKFKEDPEDSIEAEEYTSEEELKNRAWNQYLVFGNKQPFKNLIKGLGPEHKEGKITKKEERETQRTMSGMKKIRASSDFIKRVIKPQPADRQIKTMNDNKKQKMHRGKIAKFLDSEEGQKRVF